MSPRSAKQFDDIRKQKKELILQSALELFAENGFHATSISQIAKKAKISKGLIYNYFESKNEILSEIIRVGFDSVYSNWDLNHDEVLSEEEFVYFIRQTFKITRENMEFWKLYMSLMLQPKVSESLKQEYGNEAQAIFKLFYNFITSKGSKDPESDMLAITALLKGSFITVITAPEFFPPEKLDDKIIAACFKILKN
jgi:AcrR family transcriptional regulator